MNNEPVAWMFQGAFDISTYVSIDKPNPDIYPNPIPLYTHPKKYCPSENNQAYEKGFIDGMAKQRDSKVQQFVEGYTHPVKELTDEDRSMLIRTLKWAEDLLREAGHDEAVNDVQDCLMILRKAQEK